MKGMQDGGRGELLALKRRTLRLIAMDRIEQTAGFEIVSKIDEIDTMIGDLQEIED